MPTERERGYGHPHQKVRAIVRRTVDAGDAFCTICHNLIVPGTPWDLDHTPDRTAYRGAAHRSCNRRDGGRRGRAIQLARANGFRVSRSW